jgi:hypothetical protein
MIRPPVRTSTRQLETIALVAPFILTRDPGWTCHCAADRISDMTVWRHDMDASTLALSLTGTKAIVVYIALGVVVVIALGWYSMRGRSRS